MRRTLLIAGISLMLALSAAPIAQAQSFSEQLQSTSGSVDYLGANAAPADYVSAPGTAQTNYVAAPATQVAQEENSGASTVTGNKQSEDSAYDSVMTHVMSLFAWLVGVAAITLDNAVYYTVVTMGDFVKHLTAVGVTWRILRDIGNILLIFGFLAIGISTVLNTEQLGWGKKLIPSLVMAAVFLNFSLFLTEAVIDVGNLFATQFYTQINGGQVAKPTGYIGDNQIANEPISNAIMANLGLTTLYGNALNDPNLFQDGAPWYIGFMAILLFIVVAFVMFSLAFILIARFIALVFLIILAPVGFAGYAIPKLKSSSDKWRHALIDQTITAPILLGLLYIALSVITDANFLTGFGTSNGAAGGFWTGFVNGNNLAGFGSVLLSFLVAMGLLLAVTRFAGSLGAFGANWVTTTAGALTFGATAWAANRTFGRGAYFASRRLRQSAGFNKFNALTGGVASRGLDRLATGSYDVRGSKLGSFGLKELKTNAGAAGKGGFVEARKQGIKQHEEEAKRIETAFKEGFNDKDKVKATAKEEEARVKAEEARVQAQQAKDAAQRERDAAEALKKRHEEEVAQLEEMEEKDGKPVSADRIAAAYQNLATSEESFKAASANLKQATDNLTEAAKNELEAKKAKEKAESGAMNKLIGDSKKAYAEGIDHPVWNVMPISPNLYSYGPGAGAAAAKIKASLKEKSTDDKLKELMKKLAKEQAEAEKKTTEEKEKPAEEGGEKK